ncbi:hypothetical protein M569_08538, partial [Genlisea aurea]
MSSLAYFDPEYETLSIRINPPQVSVDNSSCKKCTVVKVDSMNKPGILLEVVQILSDLDFLINKAYISSDGGWFMDVFHVTDQQGQKITDPNTIDYIEKALGPKGHTSGVLKSWPEKRVALGQNSMGDYNAIELIGRDRPGLLSEISAVVANLHINVVAAEVWTHNRRIACILYVNDDATSRAVVDPSRLSLLEDQLNNLLRGRDDASSRTSFGAGSTHVDRRLHQMLFSDRDYEYEGCCPDDESYCSMRVRPQVTVERCVEKDYSVVNVHCKDRPKLMFDIVCTLTDMDYVVFHANISSTGPDASHEYFIRHRDGCTLETDAEQDMVIKCLEAAIKRRISEGLSLELCAKNRVGLLSEVTRVLRENGLSVTRAGVTTEGEEATNVFYVSDASGKPVVDSRTIETLRKEIGETMRFSVRKTETASAARTTEEGNGWGITSFFFGSLLEKL